jgi:GNAT superfamily N-acetyltransferase
MKENVTFSVATEADFDGVRRKDRHLSDEALRAKLLRGEVLVARSPDDVCVGYLRWGLFWDEFPFANLLWIDEPLRRCGIGHGLVEAWHGQMRERGFAAALTSTLANEPAQHFWRTLGYRDCGALFLPGETAEIFLRREL